LVKSLGADRVIDYTKEDFTKNGDTYDIIFDTVGKSTYSHCKNSLKQKGRYLITVMGLVPVVQTIWTSLTAGIPGSKGRKVIFAMSIEKIEALSFIKKIIEAGKIKPVIDRTYPLEQIAEAHVYVEKGHKKGNVVITVGHNNNTNQDEF
jgi:NADPH:quinone reductase-like Zn-dependent oxidoreductase